MSEEKSSLQRVWNPTEKRYELKRISVKRTSSQEVTPFLLRAPRFIKQFNLGLKPVIIAVLVCIVLYTGSILWLPKEWWWVVKPF